MINQVFAILLFVSTLSTVSSSQCGCLTDEHYEKSSTHLKLVTKINAMKMLPHVRSIMLHTTSEKHYLLERTRYDVIKDLQNTYGRLITHTDFHRHFVDFIEEFGKMVQDEKTHSVTALHSSLSPLFSRFFSSILPSTFLCLSMGECLSAPPQYVQCMTENAPQWTSHFGNEPTKMARRLADSVHRYKTIDLKLSQLHSLLVGAEGRVDEECARNYTHVTGCGACIADRIGYCRPSCLAVSTKCYGGLSQEWDQIVIDLKRLSEEYHEGFYILERGLHNSLRRLVEVSSPLLARAVVDTCGALGRRANAAATRAAPIGNNKPQPVAKRTERLVEQLQNYVGHWRRTSEKLCGEPSTEHFCWNGTNIVRATDSVVFEDHLPTVMKNVRPRPQEPVLEGSGGVPWSDDEDLTEGSGSGNGFDDVVPAEEDVFGTSVIEHTAATHGMSRLVPTSPSPNSSLDDDVVLSEQADDEPSAASTSLLTSTVLLVSLLLSNFL